MPTKAKSLSASAVKLRLLKRLRCTLKFEKRAWSMGARMVAGVDEVGRGSLFGPVVAAAVILRPEYRIRGLRDSKLLLADRREVLRLLPRNDDRQAIRSDGAALEKGARGMVKPILEQVPLADPWRNPKRRIFHG